MNLKRKLWWVRNKDKIFKIYTIALTLVVVVLGIMYFTYSKFTAKNEMSIYETTVEPFIKNDYFIASYIEGEWSNEIPGKNDGYEVDKIVCDNDAVGTWDTDKWAILIENATQKIKCSVYFKVQTQFDFDYTGAEQVIKISKSGTYKLETWGSQGGSGVNKNTDTGDNTYYVRNGGYGGYSIGYITLEKGDILYVNVGGGGTTFIDTQTSYSTIIPAGYNGGGYGVYYANGGGATDISTISGTLSTLEEFKDKILIVSGGGGGTAAHVSGGGYCLGGSGGGTSGVNGIKGNGNYTVSPGIGGTQTSGYKFGQGENGVVTTNDGKSGGGGGYYGGTIGTGSTSWTECAGGGSGYIGNSLLTNKVMYCYNCTESSEENTKTISTTCAEETPTENCAKKGNGYARITYVE